MRLDRWLAARLESLSRARIQALVRDGAVTRGNETISEANCRVKPGETYVINVPAPAPLDIAGEDMGLSIVHEDADVIVIDKPAGLVVHPAAGHASGTLVNALVAHCKDSLSGIGGVARPGIVHRLDKDTSGLLVVAKTDLAHRELSEQFKAHGADGRLERMYRALVWGAPVRPAGTIDVPLARSQANRLKIAPARGAAGRRAVTHYRLVETYRDSAGAPLVSLLELQLETGRTHQIRVHLAHIGHPVLGDPLYGAGFKTRASALDPKGQAALAALQRQALHAARLGFTHPRTGRALQFESNLPSDINALVLALRSDAANDSLPSGSAGARRRRGTKKKPAIRPRLAPPITER